MFNEKRIQELEDRVSELEISLLKEKISKKFKEVTSNYPELTLYYDLPKDTDGFFPEWLGYNYGRIFIDNITIKSGNNLDEVLNFMFNDLEKEIVYYLHGKEKMKKEAEELQNKKKK